MSEGAQPSIDKLPHAHKTEAGEREPSPVLLIIRMRGVIQSQFLPPFLHQIIIISYFSDVKHHNCIAHTMAVWLAGCFGSTKAFLFAI